VLRHARDSVSDLLFGFRSIPSNVVIIAIDDQSIRTLGQWPWPRALFAQAVNRLSGASVIGIDVNFKEASRVGSADDRVLADAMRTARVPVVLASELQRDGTFSGPMSVLASVSTQGIANLTLDSDGIARSIRLIRGNRTAFAAQLAQQIGTKIPSSASPERINYYGPSGTVPAYSFLDLIQQRIPSYALVGHVVLIGATAHDLQDYQNTPIGLMSGVEIQATIVANTVTNDFLASSLLASVLITFIAGLLGLVLAMTIQRIWLVVLALVGITAVVWVGVFLLFNSGIILDLVMPTVAVIASGAGALGARYAATSKERRFIHDTFSRYLAPQIVAELLRDPSKVRLGGQKRELTILFSDIRGFTTLSESMPPQELGRFLNRYLSAMTDIILQEHGVIDKYIGDAIMAFWGAPLDDRAHALRGIRAAIAMIQKSDIAIGIGLNTGSVTVGNMGSEKRFDYTAIGDEVNLASRLEGLTKTYGVGILASENVVRHLSEQDIRDIPLRELDRVRVKGKTKSVTIFEVMTPERANLILPHNRHFAEGLARYYGGDWHEAKRLFDEFLTAVGGTDGPAELLRQRCVDFLEHPIKYWDGVFEMSHK
jgi:adenylate cyclase